MYFTHLSRVPYVPMYWVDKWNKRLQLYIFSRSLIGSCCTAAARRSRLRFRSRRASWRHSVTLYLSLCTCPSTSSSLIDHGIDATAGRQHTARTRYFHRIRGLLLLAHPHHSRDLTSPPFPSRTDSTGSYAIIHLHERHRHRHRHRRRYESRTHLDYFSVTFLQRHASPREEWRWKRCSTPTRRQDFGGTHQSRAHIRATQGSVG